MSHEYGSHGGCAGEENDIKGTMEMKREDAFIYACVIVGGGIGLILGKPLPGVIVGLGLGYLLKSVVNKDKEK
jgi:hypothetical protein